MTLVRVNEDMILDIDDIQGVAWDVDMKKVKVLFKSNDNFLYTDDKKVLDTICGSEEHLVNDADINILKAGSITSGHLN